MKPKNLLMHISLLILAAVSLIPFLWLVSTSLKSGSENIFAYPPELIPRHFTLESYFGVREWRPLIDWTLKDILAIHEKYSIPLNPLYSKGAQRVGCFPCIMSSKGEMREIARQFPERIDTIREQENAIGSTFFSPNKVPPRFRSKECETGKGRKVKIATVDDVVRWANTGKGAVGLPCDWDLFAEETKDLPPQICLAQHLACE